MKALVFDFGGVLVDWNPHHLYDSYFGSKEKATWFQENICTNEWNSQMDGGKPFCQVKDVYPFFKLLDGMVVSAEEHCIKPSHMNVSMILLF